jgi:transcriptional regulator with XRE-family HTH domain
MGRKVERIRKFRGIKQEYVANKLSISQKQYSNIEQQDEIEEQLLEQIAEILDVTSDTIKNFDDNKIVYYINSTHTYMISK